MKQKTHRLLSLLLCLVMVLGLMPMTAFAEDTRTEVDTIKATAIINVPSYGEPTNYPGFTVTEGSPARIAETMTRWQKKNTVTGKWDSVFNDNTFTEGTWRVYVQVRIDNDYGNYGKTHKLSKNPQLFVNGVEWTIDGKTMFDKISSSSLAKFYSQEYEVTSSPLPQEHNITVINGVAKNKNYIDITKAKPGDKVVLLAEDRRDKGWAFEKWVVTGATVDNEKQMNTQFIMPEGNVTAEATYIPCDISIKAVKLTLGNYAVGKKASDISVKIITPDVVDFSYGDTYRCYNEDDVALGGSYVLCYLEGETVKRLGADELIKEGVEYFLEVHIKSDEGYTFLGLKEENVTLDGTAGGAMFMRPNNAVYSFMLTPLGASHTHTYGTEWKSDAYKHWHECSCGAKSEEAAHTAGEWIIDTPATATTSGSKHKECTVCGYTMATETIPATGGGEHTHSYGSEWKNDADNHWHECSCGDKKDTAAHTAGEWIIDTPATATTSGSKHKECTVCGYTMATETIPATGGGEHTHSYGSEWKNDADNHWHECSCGDKKDTAAHTAGEWIIDTPATATTSGSKHKECTVCGYTMTTETIPATGGGEHTHNYSSDWKSDSINHWKECSCGDKADVAAHSFKWVVDKEATATKKGSKHEECKVCGYQRPAVEIPATGSTTKPTDPTESNPNTGALDDVPQTGDNSNMILWIVLLLASGLGVTGTVMYSKRKKYVK